MLSQLPKPLTASSSFPSNLPIPNPSLSLSHLSLLRQRRRPSPLIAMASASNLPAVNDSDLDRFAAVADASGHVIRQYFRQKIDILDKPDSSPVTIADQTAEEHMFSIISENFPSHAVCWGVITDWKGNQLSWEASANSHTPSFNVLAAGDKQIHQQALNTLQWE